MSPQAPRYRPLPKLTFPQADVLCRMEQGQTVGDALAVAYPTTSSAMMCRRRLTDLDLIMWSKTQSAHILTDRGRRLLAAWKDGTHPKPPEPVA